MDDFNNENLNNEDGFNGIKEKNKTSKLKFILFGVLFFAVAAVILYFSIPWNILLSKNKSLFSKMISNDVNSISKAGEDLSKNDFLKFFSENYEGPYELLTKLTIGEDVLNSQIITDNNFMAIKADRVYDKFILFDTHNMKVLWDNLQLYGDDLPNEMVTEKDLIDTLNFTSKEKKQIKKSFKKYTQMLLTMLDEDNFVKNENVEIEYKEGKLNVASIEMQVSETELMKIEKEILKNLKKDKILDIFIDKSNKFEILYKNAGYKFSEINLTKEDAIKAIDEYIAQIEEVEKTYSEEKIEDEHILVLRYYYDKNNTPVKREFLEKYTYDNEVAEDMLLSFMTIDNSEEEYYEITSFAPYDFAIYYETFANTIKKSGKNSEHNLKYAVNGYVLSFDEETQNYKWDLIDYKQEYLMTIENSPNNELKLHLIHKNSDDTDVNLNILGNVLNINAKVPGSMFGYDDKKILLEGTFIKNINTAKENIKSEGALDLTDSSSEIINTEFEKIRNNLSAMGLFEL